MLNEALKQFINSINISNAYYEFEDSDIFILDNEDFKYIFVFENEQIYSYKDNEMILFSKNDFIA
ncbi:hypothetical protein IY804_02195, partial [Campylobacter volucris]